ncbi:class I SAM-dependent methyltransferase [Planctomycetota bacterium]|nr:class I SAM-dependent methyltransferase [Planctomycetota bacterium]
MLFERCTYDMPRQTQKQYWESQWQQHDFDIQIKNAKRKAWWPVLNEYVEQLSSDDIIVEAGCGLAQFVYLLQQQDKTVLGLDITDKALHRVKQVYNDLQLQLQDVRQFALEDNSVSMMISLGVVEHFQEGPHTILKEAARVIKPGGYLFITVPYSNFFRRCREPITRLKRQLISPFTDRTFYQYTFSKKLFYQHLQEQGFEPQRVLLHHAYVAVKKDINVLFYPFSLMPKFYAHNKPQHAFARLTEMISPSIFSHMMMVVAQKQPLASEDQHINNQSEIELSV